MIEPRAWWGIGIPLPQRDVHLKSSASRPVAIDRLPERAAALPPA